jgi:hypothetical protein
VPRRPVCSDLNELREQIAGQGPPLASNITLRIQSGGMAERIGRHASLADQPRAEPLGGRQVMVACRRPHSHLPLIGQPRRNSNGAQVARVLEGAAVEHGLNAIRGFFHVTRRVSFGRQESPEVSKVIREGL